QDACGKHHSRPASNSSHERHGHYNSLSSDRTGLRPAPLMPIEHDRLNSVARASSENATERYATSPHTIGGITAIVPARDEEAVIAECVESLAKQREITEIVVVNDQSSDGTARIVRNLATQLLKLRLLEAP